MSRLRAIGLSVILGTGILLAVVLYWQRTQPALRSTLAPVFQVAGKSTSAINRALARVIPVDEIDEKEYGEAIAARYMRSIDETDVDYRYLNALLAELKPFIHKPFNYRVFILEQQFPNAYAMPGGVIVVTRGLLDAMQSEAQIMAVLSHEVGHIELGHCFRAVKFELLAEKLNAPSLGKLADFATNMMFRHSFNKTEEQEADDYAWDMVLQTNYNPRAISEAFRQLSAGTGKQSKKKRLNVFNDYFMTHPPIPLRVDNYLNRAEAWWRSNQGERRYNGSANLQKRIPMRMQTWPGEWIKQ